MTFHVMIIPTLGCQCNCKYCWGSESTKEMMDISVIDDIITWLKDFRDDKVHFTFHGGEPLLAGYDIYAEALEKLSKIAKALGVSVAYLIGEVPFKSFDEETIKFLSYIYNNFNN